MSSSTLFGTLPGGLPIEAYTFTNANGIELEVLTYGGIVRRIVTPDRHGTRSDITLGFATLDPYRSNEAYLGVLVGRVANRIARGRFVLDGDAYSLPRNEPPHHLHGGVRGFGKVVWAAEPFERADACGLVLTYTSRAGEEGYPGTLHVRVTYTLADDDTWTIDYHATTDRPTPINLTHHTYFNLLGAGTNVIDGHELQLHADRYLPVDDTGIPTGGLASVGGTRFDFRTMRPIGGDAVDHMFIVDGEAGTLRPAARAYEPTTGRTLTVRTTLPGVQLFTADGFDPGVHGFGPRAGFALEAQHFIDAPNHPAFPSVILRPGEVYREQTVYAFAVR